MAFSLIRELRVSITLVVIFLTFVSFIGETYGEEDESEAGGVGGSGGQGFGGGGTGVGDGGIGSSGTGFGGGGTNVGGGGVGSGTGFGGGGTGVGGSGVGSGTGFGGGGTGVGGGGIGSSGTGFGGGGTGIGGGGLGGNGGFNGGGLGSGLGGDNPPEIVPQALECLNEKHIYRGCEEAWRLTLTGDLYIPEAQTEEYCEGPCFSETHLALNCIENILHNFRFYNRATVRDIRETLKSGCSYGPERGHFNVFEHMEDDEENGSELMESKLGPLIGTMLFTVVLLL